VAAVLLTYMAVSLAAVPIALTQYHKQRSAQQQAQAATPATSPAPKPAMDFAKALGTLALIGLASPFLALSNPGQGAIGLIILFVGIRIAWRITAGRTVSIEGPFREAVPATPG
jgi:predicted lipid-binding transport protein (Tim44 family)